MDKSDIKKEPTSPLDSMTKRELERQKLYYEIKKYKRAWVDILVALSSTFTLILAIASIAWAFFSGILEIERRTNELENLKIEYDNKKLIDKKDSLNNDILKFEFEKQNLSDSIELFKNIEREIRKNNQILNKKNETLNMQNEDLKSEINSSRESTKLEQLRHYNLALQTKETLKQYILKSKNKVQTYEQYIDLEKEQMKILTSIMNENIKKLNPSLQDEYFFYTSPGGKRNGKLGENFEFFIGVPLFYENTKYIEDIRIIEIVDEFLKNLIYINDIQNNKESINLKIESVNQKVSEIYKKSLMHEFREIKEVLLYKNDSTYYKKELIPLVESGNYWILFSLYVKEKLNLLGYNNIILMDNPTSMGIIINISIKNLFLEYYNNLNEQDKQKVKNKYKGQI